MSLYSRKQKKTSRAIPVNCKASSMELELTLIFKGWHKHLMSVTNLLVINSKFNNDLQSGSFEKLKYNSYTKIFLAVIVNRIQSFKCKLQWSHKMFLISWFAAWGVANGGERQLQNWITQFEWTLLTRQFVAKFAGNFWKLLKHYFY